jgi:hypothetical protein
MVCNEIVDGGGWYPPKKPLRRASWTNPVELCYNCGWNTTVQAIAHGYSSRLNIIHARGNYAIYEVGPNWLLRDEINTKADGATNDWIAQTHLKDKGVPVPLIEMHRFGGGVDDKFAFTVMSRARGKPLEEVLPDLTDQQKTALGVDLARHIRSWRQLTSDRLEAGDGSQLREFPFMCLGPGPCGDVPHEGTAWVEKLTNLFRKTLIGLKSLRAGSRYLRPEFLPEVDKEVLQIKAFLLEDHRPRKPGSNDPQGGQYVFTHGDLNDTNIFVSEDKPGEWTISSIIDWEFGGYWPWWVEGSKAGMSSLRPYMPLDAFFPGYDPKLFRANICDKGPLHDIIEGCFETGREEHIPNEKNVWYRRPFCECKPYSQVYWSEQALGIPAQHHTEYPPTSLDDIFQPGWNELVAKEQEAKLS